MPEETVTLLCRWGGQKQCVYELRVLHGVSMDGARGANAAMPFGKTADRALLIVPKAAAAGYVPPQQWHTLTKAERAQHFTLQTGDVFLRGLHSAAAPDALLRLGGFVITTVDEKTTGGTLAHFAVGGGRTYRYGGGLA